MEVRTWYANVVGGGYEAVTHQPKGQNKDVP